MVQQPSIYNEFLKYMNMGICTMYMDRTNNKKIISIPIPNVEIYCIYCHIDKSM